MCYDVRLMTRNSKVERYRGVIDVDRIDPDAYKVLRRLRKFDHTVYLVGGCVRDLFLDREPKDFDIATSATPRQVKKAFRNCRIIGRRFRLAHIYFHGPKTIEVSTFRAMTENEGDDLLITDDNVFGTEAEDALRRDFTINALFYDLTTDEVIDYVGGMRDLRNNIIRVIGDPAVRFREDPVRMLRAIKFATRLGLSFEADTWRALLEARKEITRSSPPRLLEELLRVLGSGHAAETFRYLHASGIFKSLFPLLSAYVAADIEGLAPYEDFIAHLEGLDAIDGGRRQLNNGVLLGALFLPFLRSQLGLYDVNDLHRGWHEDFEVALNDLLSGSPIFESLPKKDFFRMQQALLMQRRLLSEGWGRREAPKKIAQKRYFEDALALFRITCAATNEFGSDLAHWNRFMRDHNRKAAEEVADRILEGHDPEDPGDGQQGDREENGERTRKRRRRSRRRRHHDHGDGQRDPHRDSGPAPH